MDRSLGEVDLALMQRLEKAVKAFPTRYDTFSMSVDDANRSTSAGPIKGGSGVSPHYGNKFRYNNLGGGETTDVNKADPNHHHHQKQQQQRRNTTVACLEPTREEAWRVMVDYVAAQARVNPSVVTIYPGRFPDAECFHHWGDWRQRRQQEKRMAHAQTTVIVPEGVRPITACETLLLSNHAQNRRVPSDKEAHVLLREICKRGAANMRAETMPRQHEMHGFVSASDTSGISSDVLACMLASQAGQILGCRCTCQASMQAHPVEPFCNLVVRIGTPDHIDESFNQSLLFRPINMHGSDAVVWLSRTDQNRTPPIYHGVKHAEQQKRKKLGSDVASLSQRLASAIEQGGRVGMAADSLLKSLLFSVADHVH